MNSKCTNCSDFINACTNCTSNGTCASCHPVNFTLSDDSTSCLCSDQYFLVGKDCLACNDIISGCKFCVTISTCNNCDALAFYELSGQDCVCIYGYY